MEIVMVPLKIKGFSLVITVDSLSQQIKLSYLTLTTL